MNKFIMLLITVVIVGTLVFAGCAGTGVEKGPQPIPKTWHLEVTPEAPSPTVEAAGKEQVYEILRDTLPADTFDGLMVKPDGTPYKFVYSSSFLACEWMTFWSKILTSYANRAGGEMLVVESGGMLARNIANIEDCIGMGDVDAILTQVDDTLGLAPAIERASDAGIAVFGAADECASDRMVSCIGSDYAIQGEMSGKWLVDYVDATGEPVTVYMINGILGCPAGAAKPLGFQRVTEGHPLITVVDGGEGLWSAAKAGEIISDVFPGHPEYNAVLDMGSMSGGIIPALKTIGRLYPVGHPEHVIVLAHDAPAITLQHMREGYLDVVVENDCWDVSTVTFMAAVKYVCLGEPVDRYYFGSWFYITEDNVDDELLYGNVMARVARGEIDYDDLPILDMSEIIQFP